MIETENEKEVKSGTVTEEVNPKEKIDYACDNFKEISKNIINQKFKYLDNWLYRKSKNYLKENTKIKIVSFPRFEYGTILKVDFGINDGSELSGPHFAISLERYDSTKNPTITVLPLTSQNKKYDLPLEGLITEEFTKRLKKHIHIINEKMEGTKQISDTNEEIKIKGEMDLLQQMIDYYSHYAKNSYACINQITTISKTKIIKPKNKFDIIGRVKCNNKTMKIISTELIKKFTNIKIEKTDDEINNNEKN